MVESWESFKFHICTFSIGWRSFVSPPKGFPLYHNGLSTLLNKQNIRWLLVLGYLIPCMIAFPYKSVIFEIFIADQNQQCTTRSNSLSSSNLHLVLTMSIKVNDFTFCSFLQEPFKSVPLLWTIHDDGLAHRLKEYNESGQIDLLNSWKRMFSRATAVVFPNYALPVSSIQFVLILVTV